jgi:hypothetical protein
MYHPWFELKTFVIDMMVERRSAHSEILHRNPAAIVALPLVTRDSRANGQSRACFTPRRRSETKHGVAVVRAEYF